MRLFNKLFGKLRHALRGIRYAVVHDLSVRLHVLVGGALLVFGYITWPLTQLECVLLVLAWLLAVITELQNTAHETALDRIHPEQHEAIGRSKDIAAGTVLLALLFIVFVVVMILLARI